jgi:cell division protein FtsB
MSDINRVGLALFVLLFLAGVGRVDAVQVSEATTDHLALAKKYEAQMNVQNTLITEHQQMKRDYYNRFFVNEKISPRKKLQKMEQHCDAIVTEATKLRDELQEFAKWHRMRAAELEGR